MHGLLLLVSWEKHVLVERKYGTLGGTLYLFSGPIKMVLDMKKIIINCPLYLFCEYNF